MIELIGITVLGVAVLGLAYWYLHKVNSDAAQQVTDALVKDIKDAADDAVKAVKEKIN